MENKPGLWDGGGAGRQKEGESSARSSRVKFMEPFSEVMLRGAEGAGNNMDVRAT